MMPKSTATSRPASSRNRLPGCMSAWKKPSRSAWRRKLWITLRPRSGRSTCDCSSRAWSLSAMPSIHSIVSTLCVVRSQSTVGTRKSGSSRVFSAISDIAAASSRRSISIATERDIVLMTSTSRSRRASAEYASALCATKKKSPRSRRKRAATLGRSTFTATDLRTPSRSISPRCTCAIEAAATAGPKLANACATGRSSEVAITASASACENGGSRSCRLSRSRAIATPTTSGRVARNCPSLR